MVPRLAAETAPSYLNAYVDRDELVLVSRDASGRLRERRTPAEYVTYYRLSDLRGDLRDPPGMDFERVLRGSRRVRSVTREGEDWVRVVWENERQLCTGRDGRVRWAHIRERMGTEAESPFVRAGIPSFEGDVGPVLRHWVDTGAKLQKPRRAYFDLETDSRVGFGRAPDGTLRIVKARILSWALVDDAGPVGSGVLEVDSDADEKRLLDAFFAAADPYDQLCAWNGKDFDFIVLDARARSAGCAANVRRWLLFDQMAAYRTFNASGAESGDEKTSLKLQDVCMALLGVGKDPFDASKTWDAWAAGGESRARLLRYNETDTALLAKLEAKTGFCDLAFTLAEAAGVLPDTHGLDPTHQVDAFLLRLGLSRGEHFPTRDYNPKPKFEGAFVLEPTAKGIVRNVHVADFARLYPSIIITWNISPETKRVISETDLAGGDGGAGSGLARSLAPGVAFTTEGVGLLPKALAEIIRLRKYYSDLQKRLVPNSEEWVEAGRKSTAYKVAVNTFYGVLGSPFSRFYDPALARSVTLAGKALILATKAAAEARGLDVIYADTDSVFVVGCTEAEFAEFVAYCNAVVYPELTRRYGCRAYDIDLAYEKTFERIVFTAKKRYAGRYAVFKGQRFDPSSPRDEIKGLEYKRGDTARLARQFQEETIRLLMGGEERPELYGALVARWKGRILDAPLSVEECSVNKKIQKSLPYSAEELGAMRLRIEAAGIHLSVAEVSRALVEAASVPEGYKLRVKKDGTVGAPIAHVQVAMDRKDRGEDVRVGSKIGYVVMDGAASPMRVIDAQDYVGECDRFYLWEKLVWPPTERLLEAAFPGLWAEYGSARPPDPARRRAVPRRGPPLPLVPMPMLLFREEAPPPPSTPPVDSSPGASFRVRVAAEDASPTTFRALRARLAAYPGNLPVEVALRTASGREAVVALDFSVSELARAAVVDVVGVTAE